MSDEELYLEATNEVEGENKNPGLWAKVMALSEGDQEKAKYKYIKLRVEQLANERKNAAPTFTKKSVDEFDLKYMPVAEFSKIKSIPETKVYPTDTKLRASMIADDLKVLGQQRA